MLRLERRGDIAWVSLLIQARGAPVLLGAFQEMAKTKGLVGVRIDKSRLEGLGPLLSVGPKGVRWAMAEAMTAAGAGAVASARNLLGEEVDRPTGWTLRSLTSLPRRVVPAGGLHHPAEQGPDAAQPAWELDRRAIPAVIGSDKSV